MATIEAGAQGRGMSIGRVYRRAFGTLMHNPGPTLGLAFLLGALPGLLITAAVQSAVRYDASEASGSLIVGASALFLLSYVAMLVLSAIVQGALTKATVAEAQSRKATVKECITAALPVALPLAGLIILWALGILVGALLFFVPAIILACIWAVAVPSIVEERVGVVSAFGRSRALTRGNRWRVFGVLLILLVAYYLLLTIFALIFGASTVMGGDSLPTMTVGFIVMSLVTGTLFNAVWGTLAPSMDVDLREVQEGGSTANLEEVFS